MGAARTTNNIMYNGGDTATGGNPRAGSPAPGKEKEMGAIKAKIILTNDADRVGDVRSKRDHWNEITRKIG